MNCSPTLNYAAECPGFAETLVATSNMTWRDAEEAAAREKLENPQHCIKSAVMIFVLAHAPGHIFDSPTKPYFVTQYVRS